MARPATPETVGCVELVVPNIQCNQVSFKLDDFIDHVVEKFRVVDIRRGEGDIPLAIAIAYFIHRPVGKSIAHHFHDQFDHFLSAVFMLELKLAKTLQSERVAVYCISNKLW